MLRSIGISASIALLLLDVTPSIAAQPGAARHIMQEGFESPFTDEVLMRIAPRLGDHTNALPPGWWPLNQQVGLGRKWSAAPEGRPGSAGRQSVKVENPGGQMQTGLMYPGWGSGRLRLRGEGRYLFTIWYRSNVPLILNAWHDGKMVDLRKPPFPEEFQRFRDLGADWAGNIFHQIAPASREWKKCSFVFETPSGYEWEKIQRSTIDIQLAGRRDGWMVVDDISISRTSRKVARERTPRKDSAATARSASGAGNLLVNGSFEVGVRGGWRVVEQRDFRAPIDTETAFHGSRSVRLDLPCFEDRLHAPGGRMRNQLQSSLIQLSPERTYTFSAYLKTSCPEGGNATLSVFGAMVPDDWTPLASREQSITEDWQRIDVTFDALEMPHQAFFLAISIRSSQSGAFWIDALQLERSDAATEFRPGEAIALGLSTTQEANLFLTTEPFEATLSVFNSGAEVKELTIPLVIRNVREEVIWSKRLALASVQPGLTEMPIRPDKTFTGSFRMEVLSPDGAVLREELIGGIVPPPREDVSLEESSMGCHIFLEAPLLRVTKRYGMRWIRLHDTLPNTRWEYVEPSKGQWAWDDAKMKLALEMGFGLLGTLHTYTYQPWGKGAWFYDETLQDTFFAPLDGYENYCYEVVNHYKEMIHDWGFMNEVGGATGSHVDGVVEMLRRAHRAAKRADPDARIVGCDFFTSHEQGYREICIENDTLGLLDVFTIHYFAFAAPETIEKFVGLGRADGVERAVWVCEDNFLKVMRAWYRREKPWIIEGTVRNNTDYGGQQLEPLRATIDDLKAYVTERANGVTRRFYYRNWPTRTTALTLSYSGFEHDGAIGPLHVTQGIYAHLLDGARFTGTVELGDTLRAHVFERRGSAVVCMWTEPGVRRRIDLAATAGAVKALDFQGNPVPSVSGLTVTEEPVFLVGKELSANALSGLLMSDAGIDLAAQVVVEDGAPVVRLEADNHSGKAFRSSVRSANVAGGVKLADMAEILAPAGGVGFVDLSIVGFPDVSGIYDATIEVGDGARVRRVGVRFPLLVARRLAAPVTLDGRLDEWEELSPALIESEEQVKLFGADEWNGARDSSALVYAGWQAGKLYFAIAVTDDKLVQRNRTYVDDCVELFFNTDLSAGRKRVFGPNAYQVVLPPEVDERSEKTVEINPTGGKGLTADKVEYASAASGDGYVVEVAIDAAGLEGADLTNGAMIGFDAAVDDSDNGMRKAQLIWAGAESNHRDTSRFGFLLLQE